MSQTNELFSMKELRKTEKPVETDSLKVQHEIHRIMGYLRFSPNKDGVFIAKCAPDNYILPALSYHFTARFGETAWAIIDEKRGLVLSRFPGESAKIQEIEDTKNQTGDDEWEKLWLHYHKTINNESRSNPSLQRQFMPKRYRKYMPEVSE